MDTSKTKGFEIVTAEGAFHSSTTPVTKMGELLSLMASDRTFVVCEFDDGHFDVYADLVTQLRKPASQAGESGSRKNDEGSKRTPATGKKNNNDCRQQNDMDGDFDVLASGFASLWDVKAFGGELLDALMALFEGELAPEATTVWSDEAAQKYAALEMRGVC